MKKILIPLFLLTLLFTNNAFAADVLDPITASPSAIVDEAKRKAIKDAIDKNLKNTQDILGENANRNILVGYAGTIGDIKQSVFNLTTDEASLQVSYDAKTAILKDGKVLKPELISLKDTAIAIGVLSSPDILTAKRIVISSRPDSVLAEKKVIYSSVVKIKGNGLTLKINDQNQDVILGKNLKLDLKTLTTANKIFGIIMTTPASTGVTLLQAKIF